LGVDCSTFKLFVVGFCWSLGFGLSTSVLGGVGIFTGFGFLVGFGIFGGVGFPPSVGFSFMSPSLHKSEMHQMQLHTLLTVLPSELGTSFLQKSLCEEHP
jgi:hypothetical protein